MFVPTRKHARMTAMDFLAFAAADGEGKRFLKACNRSPAHRLCQGTSELMRFNLAHAMSNQLRGKIRHRGATASPEHSGIVRIACYLALLSVAHSLGMHVSPYIHDMAFKMPDQGSQNARLKVRRHENRGRLVDGPQLEPAAFRALSWQHRPERQSAALQAAEADMAGELGRVGDEALKYSLEHGVAFLHDTMAPSDRAAAERLFATGAVQVPVPAVRCLCQLSMRPVPAVMQAASGDQIGSLLPRRRRWTTPGIVD